MSKLIVVVGVTGIQGSSVAKTFLQLPGWRVRGISRNPSSAASQALSSLDVEIIKGDLDDKSSLIPAFADAHTIFANTDFFAHFFSAIGSPAIAAGRNPKIYGYEREVEQGLNIAEVAASPAVLKTLERFIYSSLSEARKWSGGKYKEVYHFDCKAEVLRGIRERYPLLAEKMSTLLMGHYVENWRTFRPLAPQRQEDGSFVMRRPTGKGVKWDFVVAGKDTGEFVRALVEMPVGKDLLGVSEAMTMPEFMDIWGKFHGVKIRYEQVSYEEFFEGIPTAMREELGDSFKYVEEFGICGGDPAVMRPEQLDQKLQLTKMEEYIKSEDWVPLLEG
ncbi:putative hscarg dehydrogenase [Rhexocercosporidium sp. MPI-PUGE-AT-0058]|nr:putative hscarg dehydrogenase [Rhexocercosporidium sp. MPI-PUGE-AT-0058]